MAKEYIEREATVMKIREWFWSAPGVHPKLDRDTAEDILFAIPAADVRPVVRGRWIGIDDEPYETWECDHCGKIIEHEQCLPNFCGECGAKMDGGQDDA